MNKLNKIKATALALALPFIGLCQQAEASNNTYFSNALFNTLLGIIILLLIIIVAFSNVVKNVADSDFFDKRVKEENSNSGKILGTLLFVLLSFNAFSQNAPVKDDRIGGLDQFTFYFMLVIILAELLVLGLLIFQFKFLLSTKTSVAARASAEREDTLMKSLTDAVPVEEEESILLDHDYDGIRELDNNLPPWWKYGFYLTIVFAVVYLFNYHVSGSSDLQEVEYQKEMAQAKLEVEEYMKTSANAVDESNVKLLADQKDIDAGKDVFMASCAACHGKAGEGTVGPNLTDIYWLHGGSIQDVFKSIKYGWPEKGMKSWKEDLSPIQIAQVTSFIHSLKGTNPANGKAPQGDAYSEGGNTPNNATESKSDSLNLVSSADSLNKASTK